MDHMDKSNTDWSTLLGHREVVHQDKEDGVQYRVYGQESRKTV